MSISNLKKLEKIFSAVSDMNRYDWHFATFTFSLVLKFHLYYSLKFEVSTLTPGPIVVETATDLK